MIIVCFMGYEDMYLALARQLCLSLAIMGSAKTLFGTPRYSVGGCPLHNFYDPCSMVALAGHSLYQRRSSNWIPHQRGLMASPVAIQCARYPCTHLVAHHHHHDSCFRRPSPHHTSFHPSTQVWPGGTSIWRSHGTCGADVPHTCHHAQSPVYWSTFYSRCTTSAATTPTPTPTHCTARSLHCCVHRWWEVQHWAASFCGCRRAPTCCTTAWVPGMSPCLHMMQQLLRQGGCCVVPWVSQLPLCGSCSWCFWHAAHSAAASKLPASEKPLKALGSSVVR